MPRIMTLNLNGYGEKHGPWAARREIIAEAIREAEPEVVVFQAVRRDPSFGGVDQAQQLSEVLGRFTFHAFEPAAIDPEGVAEGLAFLAGSPARETSSCRLSLAPGAEDPVRRMVFQALFSLPGGELRVFNAHFSYISAQNDGNLREAVRYLDSFSGPALLLGDFNAVPDQPSLEPLRQAGWTEAWAALRPGESGFTFESDRPHLRIDQAWVNRDLEGRVSAIRVVPGRPRGGARMSDHLGLLVEVGEVER